MKTKKNFLMACLALFGAAMIYPQSAHKIINKHVKAIGGKKLISSVNSIYMEAGFDLMGYEGTGSIQVINGIGARTDMGLIIPYTVKNDYGRMFYINYSIAHAEVNKAIDPEIFEMN